VLLLIYFVATGVLAGLTIEQRMDAIASAQKSLAAFAQLTEEQTTLTIQNTEQTLEIAETRIGSVTQPGSAVAEPVRLQLQDLLASRPFLKQITLLDSRGRTVFTSANSEPGLDLSDRDYFIHHRDNPAGRFLLSAPVRARSTAEWIVPASRALRGPNGEFAGVIVASVDPYFFSRAWTNDKTIEDQATTLWRRDGTVIIRSPFDAQSMGINLKSAAVVSGLNAGGGEGTLRTVSRIDGQDRLVAYLRIAAYPDFGLSVTQVTDRALAAWRRIAWIVALGWLVAGVALASVALGLVRESRARQATQDRYSIIFAANPYPMVVMDRETRQLLAVNDAAVEEYGWSREEVLAMPINDFYPPEDLPALEAMRRTSPEGGAFVVRGLRHRKKDGTIFDVEMHTRAFDLDGRSTVLTIMENVSERRSVEAQLRQAQKMEAVGQLTGGIAHDFNNVLFIILANTDALQEEEGLSAAVAERLGQIAKAVGRASALTHQLLAFSRKQPLRPQPTDLNDLVSDVGKLLRRALGEQIEIESILAENLGVANVDRALLETALLNLCINARDAMPDGGRLLIETCNVTLNDEYVASNPDAAVGVHAMIAVTDNGTGIPPEALQKVFEPFFTTKEVGKGTGLGLSMVYGFIKQSHGHIKIYSEVGVGTSIKLYLPCCDQAAEPLSNPRSASLPRGTERILVVEDEPQVRGIVVQQLQDLGYTVTEAPDAVAGVAAFESTTQPYDLMLTDVVMPGQLNGKVLADKLLRRWPKTRVLFMSGFTERSIVRSGQLDKDAALLSKPFRKADLAQMVRQVLDGGDGHVPV
jgi:PAS domain S-box-containing protein